MSHAKQFAGQTYRWQDDRDLPLNTVERSVLEQLAMGQPVQIEQFAGNRASGFGTQPSPGQLLGSGQENSNVLALDRKHQEWLRPLLGREDVEVGPPYRLRTHCRTDRYPGERSMGSDGARVSNSSCGVDSRAMA